MKTRLIVSKMRYETLAVTVDVNHETERGLMRRAKQLSNEHAVYWDNWEGCIPAQVAIASKGDSWGYNSIISGQWCQPVNDWLDFS